MNEKTKKNLTLTLFIIAGVLFMPLMVAIFLLDRVIMVPMVWYEPKSFSKWVKQFELIIYSTLRVGVGLIIYEIIRFLS